MFYSKIMDRKYFIIILLLCSCVLISALPFAYAQECKPTGPDMLGPFYKAGAPVRSAVGKGYVLNGVVRSSRDCAAVAGAQIEFWLAGPEGRYGDDYRATVFSDDSGAYRFESSSPEPYYGRPPHIHIRVSAKGMRTLVTQHYPEKGKSSASFDLVLIPSE